MVITGLSWPECKKTRIRVIRQEPSCFQPSCLKEKSDACILPTTIGRLPEFTRQISYIFIDDIEEPPRERTPLRKVPQLVSADHIETIMKSVPRKATIAEGPSWRCRYWIWNALDVSMDSIEDALDLMILQSLVSESINHWHSRGCLGY